MTALKIEKEKLEIIKWVVELKDGTALAKLKMLREKPNETNWWDEITNDEKEAIKEGIKNIEEGKIKPHNEVKSDIKNGYRIF